MLSRISNILDPTGGCIPLMAGRAALWNRAMVNAVTCTWRVDDSRPIWTVRVNSCRIYKRINSSLWNCPLLELMVMSADVLVQWSRASWICTWSQLARDMHAHSLHWREPCALEICKFGIPKIYLWTCFPLTRMPYPNSDNLHVWWRPQKTRHQMPNILTALLFLRAQSAKYALHCAQYGKVAQDWTADEMIWKHNPKFTFVKVFFGE